MSSPKITRLADRDADELRDTIDRAGVLMGIVRIAGAAGGAGGGPRLSPCPASIDEISSRIVVSESSCLADVAGAGGAGGGAGGPGGVAGSG